MDREDMIERYARFLREYVDDSGNEVYLNKLKDLLTVTPKRSLAIDWTHLNSFDPELAGELLENPEESILAAEDAIQIVLREPPLLKEEEFKVHARFYNLPRTLLVKELGSEHINRLIQVEGIITRVSEVKPFVEKAVFACKDCGNEMVRLQRPYENIVKPSKCDACGSRNVDLDVEKSRFINFQSFRLQDRPESLKGGQMPRFVDAILLDDLVDTALPGDRVLATGILRVILEQRDKRPIFKKVLEVNHIEQLSKEIEELEISPEDEQKIRELAKRKDIVDAIVDSIAPAIWGHRTVKKGIALALFGGVQRTLPDGTKLRGESHVLLVGDPGVAKSQILRYVANLAPRAIYTSGKSSSAAGLTAAAVRDEFTGSWVLEAGVLVLADGGFALIDEFDKMSDRDRSAIHEALEQQSYHHDFELLLADGRKVRIGELVDELIEKNRDKVIIGKDTEILPVDDIELLAYDLERKEIVKVKADRVSRHKAPDRFIRIKLSNGREITVTPEHPVMVWENGRVREKPAESVRPWDYVLAVKEYPALGDGCIPAEELLLEIMKPQNMRKRFKRGARLPERAFLMNRECIRDFLRELWARAGKVGRRLSYITVPGRGLVEDLQDLLLILGVPSSIEVTLSGWKLVVPTERADFLRFSGTPEESKIGAYVPGETVRDILRAASLLRAELKHSERLALRKEAVPVKTVHRIIGKIENRAEEVRTAIETGDVKTLRSVARVWNVYTKYGLTQFSEKREPKKYIEILKHEARLKLEEALEIVNSTRKRLEDNFVLLKVKRVEVVPNDRWEWVYDVTVEPHHLFVSHGLVLHNTISISKAGITATLNARTTVIAAANPKFGRFNRHKSLPEQLDLPPTLLSRFDLIFLLLDEPDEKVDASIAEHILRVRRGEAEAVTPKIPYDLLKKYIAYARKNVHPVLSREAMEEIKRYYVRMRKGFKRPGEDDGVQPIPITARQLEALIRLSEAHARMRLSETVTREDARAAIAIIEDMIRKIAVDEEGTLDVSILEVGKSSKKINKIDRMVDIIKSLESEGEFGAPEDRIIEAAKQAGLGSENEIKKLINDLKRDARIYEPRAGFYRVL